MWDLTAIADRRAGTGPAQVRIAFAHLSFRRVARSREVRNKSLFSAHFPALGLLSLAQQLRDRFPDRELQSWVRYFDEEAYPDRDAMEAAIRAWLGPADLGILGMSTYTSSIDHITGYCRRFAGSDILVVLGGAHVTVVPDTDLPCHVIVRGEGSGALYHDHRQSGYGRLRYGGQRSRYLLPVRRPGTGSSRTPAHPPPSPRRPCSCRPSSPRR